MTMLTLETIDRFHDSCLERGRSQNTARGYRSDLKEFLIWVKIQQQITEIPVMNLEPLAMQWLNHYRRISAPRTTRRRITSLRSWGQWAKVPPILTDYTAPTPGQPVPHPIPEGLSGLERMRAVAKSDQQEALIGLCGLAGLRIHEALQVKPGDLDQDMWLTVHGKGSKIRYVPISTRAWSYMCGAFLEAYPSNLVCPFEDRVGRSIITRLGERANLKREISSHDLRATFATMIYDETKDIRVVQELLGHASITTTQVYTESTRRTMQKAVEL